MSNFVASKRRKLPIVWSLWRDSGFDTLKNNDFDVKDGKNLKYRIGRTIGWKFVPNARRTCRVIRNIPISDFRTFRSIGNDQKGRKLNTIRTEAKRRGKGFFFTCEHTLNGLRYTKAVIHEKFFCGICTQGWLKDQRIAAWIWQYIFHWQKKISCGFEVAIFLKKKYIFELQSLRKRQNVSDKDTIDIRRLLTTEKQHVSPMKLSRFDS